MATPLVGPLVAAFQSVPDPRRRRGLRHPCAGLLALAFLGCLCRHTELAVLRRWARRHGALLRGPLGFDRPDPPHATTPGRLLSAFDPDPFQRAFVGRLRAAPEALPLEAAAADGKTCKQGRGADGDPVHVLNVFVQDVKVCLGQWPVGDGTGAEPEVLKAHLQELFDRYPGLGLLTGDALFCQRPLAGLSVAAGRDYLPAVKDNQPDLAEALRTAFAAAQRAEPDARSAEKRGRCSTSGGCGSIARRAPTRARG